MATKSALAEIGDLIGSAATAGIVGLLLMIGVGSIIYVIYYTTAFIIRWARRILHWMRTKPVLHYIPTAVDWVWLMVICPFGRVLWWCIVKLAKGVMILAYTIIAIAGVSLVSFLFYIAFIV